VLSEIVESLQETFHQILRHEHDLALLTELFVVEEPESVAFWIELFLQNLHSTTCFVLMIYHGSLEVKEVPWAGR